MIHALKPYISHTAVAMAAALTTYGIVQASTTISTDISTAGSLSAATSTLATTTLSALTVSGDVVVTNNLTVNGSTQFNGSLAANIVPLQDTAANLSSVVASSGQMVYETDTKYSVVGDGVTPVGNLFPLGQYGTSSPTALLSVDTSNLTKPAVLVSSTTATSFVISSNGWVGIGTSSPAAPFSIGSQITAANPAILIAPGVLSSGNGSGITMNAANSNKTQTLTGGAVNIASGNGSSGGNLTLSAGSTYGFNSYIGNGGSAYLSAGNGNTTATFGNADNGGSVYITAGQGGKVQFTGTAGLGGNVTISAGNGGANSSGGTPNKGGSVTINPGAAGGSGAASGNVLIATSSGNVGIGTSTPIANFQASNQASNATTTVELGKGGQTLGTCLKLYRSDGSAIYAYVAAGATAFTLSTTACANVAGF